jgi:hypothetical protein
MCCLEKANGEPEEENDAASSEICQVGCRAARVRITWSPMMAMTRQYTRRTPNGCPRVYSQFHALASTVTGHTRTQAQTRSHSKPADGVEPTTEVACGLLSHAFTQSVFGNLRVELTNGCQVHLHILINTVAKMKSMTILPQSESQRCG